MKEQLLHCVCLIFAKVIYIFKTTRTLVPVHFISRQRKQNIFSIQKNLFDDFLIVVNRFCDVQQNILNVTRHQTHLFSLIISKIDDDEKSNLNEAKKSASDSVKFFFAQEFVENVTLITTYFKQNKNSLTTKRL